MDQELIKNLRNVNFRELDIDTINNSIGRDKILIEIPPFPLDGGDDCLVTLSAADYDLSAKLHAYLSARSSDFNYSDYNSHQPHECLANLEYRKQYFIAVFGQETFDELVK